MYTFPVKDVDLITATLATFDGGRGLDMSNHGYIYKFLCNKWILNITFGLICKKKGSNVCTDISFSDFPEFYKDIQPSERSIRNCTVFVKIPLFRFLFYKIIRLLSEGHSRKEIGGILRINSNDICTILSGRCAYLRLGFKRLISIILNFDEYEVEFYRGLKGVNIDHYFVEPRIMLSASDFIEPKRNTHAYVKYINTLEQIKKNWEILDQKSPAISRTTVRNTIRSYY